MTTLLSTRHHALAHARPDCHAEATTVSTSLATEIYVRCAPVASGAGRGGCLRQTRALYKGLGRLLRQAGAEMGDVVIEKAYFRNLAGDLPDFQEVRRRAYRKWGVSGERLPATTYLGQAPCRARQDIELQAYAIVPRKPGAVRVEPLSPSREHATAKLLEVGPARHLYVSSIDGRPQRHGGAANGNGDLPGPFGRESDAAWETALKLVRSQGIECRDVVRTWIYLDDIDRDYAELNASRNAVFQREGVARLPASTGIGGFQHPLGNRVAIDLYALLNPEIAQIEVMHTPTLNEAAEYGSSFSRGMKMALPEQTYLFISGTASVDEYGATVHTGDVRRQIDRMLLNIEELLRPHGASWADLAHGVTYLKSARYYGLYQQMCAERGIVDVPHTIVVADVCRPELLCEMEAVAVLPTG